MPRISRRAAAAILVMAALIPDQLSAADALKEIRLDWATYNPASVILKQKGLKPNRSISEIVNMHSNDGETTNPDWPASARIRGSRSG